MSDWRRISRADRGERASAFAVLVAPWRAAHATLFVAAVATDQVAAADADVLRALARTEKDADRLTGFHVVESYGVIRLVPGGV